MMNLRHPLILASKSPRRQQILREAGFEFEIFTKEVDESFDQQMDVREVAKYLSNKKNRAYRSDFTDEIIITADTTVVLGNLILNKPADTNEAFSMLKLLAGGVHEVITGVTISTQNDIHSFSDTTFVTFKNLSDSEIQYYVDHYRPLDKAGAYGIQEWIGMIGVSKLEGSYFNVVGLPIDRVYDFLVSCS